MSLGANRYKHSSKDDERALREERRTRRQKLALLAAGKFYETQMLVPVFGICSVDNALLLCLRVKKMKRRIIGVPDPGIPLRKHGSGRNYHHLTPQCRRGRPYHGGSPRNMLLIRIPRHDAWHKLFGVMTLEEIIATLASCSRINQTLCIAVESPPIREYQVRIGKRERWHRQRIIDCLAA